MLELSSGSQRLVTLVLGLAETIPNHDVKNKQLAIYALENLNSKLDQMRIQSI